MGGILAFTEQFFFATHQDRNIALAKKRKRW